MTANTATGQTMPVAPPTLLPNGMRGGARPPWQRGPVTTPGGEAESRKECKFIPKKINVTAVA